MGGNTKDVSDEQYENAALPIEVNNSEKLNSVKETQLLKADSPIPVTFGKSAETKSEQPKKADSPIFVTFGKSTETIPEQP